MSAILNAISQAARNSQDRIAIAGDRASISFHRLESESDRYCRRLVALRSCTVGLLMDNCPAWSILDLASQKARLPLVPLPVFFSSKQLIHALRDARIDTIFTDIPITLGEMLRDGGISIKSESVETIAADAVHMLSLDVVAPPRLPPDIAKITYTSGTTGEPKGVCLTQAAIDSVARSLVNRVGLQPRDRHLSLLPLSTLLENIGGVYAPLLAGATCCLPALHSLDSDGATSINATRMLEALQEWEATTSIMVPQMLQALVETLEGRKTELPSLRFLAVGGAPVSQRLLRRADACGVPVYEGYGLSECASVVAVNGPGQRRIGSVGKPLPHVNMGFSEDGEILVAGASFSGYLGHGDKPVERLVGTGDLGHLDRDGYLYVTGRKKNMFVTAFGRNVAPEWIERELTLHPSIAQAAVFGEARPWNTAVVVPARSSTDNSLVEVTTAIAETNRILPEYAHVSRWIAADGPFLPTNGQLTATGRIRRKAIWHSYGARIEKIYSTTSRALSE